MLKLAMLTLENNTSWFKINHISRNPIICNQVVLQLHSIVYTTMVQLRSFSSFKMDAFITLYICVSACVYT
jgi:hypothetical protein